MKMILDIPTYKVEEFNKRLAILNKKQAAYGMVLTTAKKLKQEYRKIKVTVHEKGDAYRNDQQTSEMVEFTTFEIENTEVVTNDGRKYTYMGCRSEVQGVPIVDVTDKQYTEQVAVEVHTCDHCHVTRERIKYFVFMDEDGKVLRVGSSCCNDYFGYKVVEYLQLFAKTFFVVGGDADDDLLCRVPLDERAYDWTAVYAKVKFVTDDFTKYDKELFWENVKARGIHPPKEDCSADFQTVVDYWKRKKEDEAECSIDGIDSFTWDCESLVTSGACPYRLLGLALAAIYTAKKKLRWNTQRKFKMDELPKYNAGQKLTFSGTVVLKRRIEQYFGYVTLVVVDVDGLQHKMFTSARRFNDVEKGDEVTVTAEFVKFDEFNEIFSAMVKKPKLIDVRRNNEEEQAGE